MSNKRRTAIDANLLIAAWSGRGELFRKALSILEDPERELIVSDALWLEVMPKAIYHEQEAESAFYQAVFARAEFCPWSSGIVDRAKSLACAYGLAAVDAIHVATAIEAGADEFVSGEKSGKPMFRVKEIRTVCLWTVP
jgi:hypothetical protein